MSTQLLPPTPASIETITHLLNAKEIVALPTETVYGLAGSAISGETVTKIFEAKERPLTDPLIVHVKKSILDQPIGAVKALVQQNLVSEAVLKWPSLHLLESAMHKFWPGPLTFVLPRGKFIPDEVTGGLDTVAIRCPNHRLFQAVLEQLQYPLAAPSANRFGKISPTEAGHVLQELNGRISAVLDGGACTVGVESTIIKIDELPLSITLLRPGKIGIPELFEHFGVEIQDVRQLSASATETQIAPGMLDQHYAPRKPLYLAPQSFSDESGTLQYLQNFPDITRVAVVGMTKIPAYLRELGPGKHLPLSGIPSVEIMARNLFSVLRTLDQLNEVDLIVVEMPEFPETNEPGLVAALRDRLRRASQNKPKI